MKMFQKYLKNSISLKYDWKELFKEDIFIINIMEELYCIFYFIKIKIIN